MRSVLSGMYAVVVLAIVLAVVENKCLSGGVCSNVVGGGFGYITG